MSYTVLARRYRSTTFDEVIGQEHVGQTLKKAIAAGRIAHAYLFCGTRGVGKTSMARILAKALNCRSADGPTPTPCGKCESCLAVARGDDMDVIEIDAASHTGVDNIRDLIEQSQYRPAHSRFKIYIIDEAHMLSKAAFNALLKTLEEPSEHVKFILATTEAEKLLPTILSRCQRYDFRNISTREIAGHLKEICAAEKIQADAAALLLVAKAGAGSMRDALSLLDRLLSVGEKTLSVELIERMLGMPRAQSLFELAQAIGEGAVAEALGQADAAINAGQSVDGLLGGLVDHFRNLLILRTCGAQSELVEAPGLAIDQLDEQAQRFDAVALTQNITILEELRRNIRQSQAGRALLDATLVRLALAEQFAAIDQVMRKTQAAAPAARPAPAEKKKIDEPAAPRPAPVAPAPAPPVAATATPVATTPATVPVAAPLDPPPASTAAWEDDDDDLPRPGKVWDGPSLKPTPRQPANPARSAAPAQRETNVEAVQTGDLDGVWTALLAALASKEPGTGGMLASGKLLAISDDLALIDCGDNQQFFERKGKKESVRDALSAVLSRDIGVKFEARSDAALAPASAPRASAAPAPMAAAPPQKSKPAVKQPAAAPPPAPSPVQTMPRPTAEVIAALREKSELITAVMDQFGAEVRWIDPGVLES